ncbi:MAG: TonB-dependent receptor [Bacteroidota bacterium]
MKTYPVFRNKTGILKTIVFLFLQLQLCYLMAQENVLDKILTISFNDESLEQALVRMEKDLGVTFSYAPDTFDGTIAIRESFKKSTVREILDEVLGAYAIYYRVQESTIQIRTQGKKSTITGTVRDTENKPVPFASVFLKNTVFGASADATGYFSFQAPEGSYTIATSVMGYSETEKNIRVTENATLEIELVITYTAEKLAEVKVFGETVKEKIEQTAQAVTIIETKTAKLQTADLGQVLASTQGVNVRRSGGLGSNTQFSLNGLQGEQVRFFIDGIPLDFLGTGNGIANVPVNLIERAEIYKGVVPIRFGADALGGAVNLVTAKSIGESTTNVSYQFGSFNTHRVTAGFRTQGDKSKFFTRGSFFYDFTNNNYKIDVNLSDETGRIIPATVERFHDDYFAIGTNFVFGLTNLKWADEVAINLFYNRFNREIQNNFNMTRPFGEPESSESVVGTTLNWKKKWTSRFNTDLTAGYSYDQVRFVDTSECVYNWLGECFTTNNPGEITFEPINTEIFDNNYFARLLVSNKIGKQGTLSFTSAPTKVVRSGRDVRLEGQDVNDPLAGESTLLTLVHGLEYAQLFASGAEVLFFGKHYLQRIDASFTGFSGEFIDRNSDELFWGVGSSGILPLNDWLSAKASYEYAVRLPGAPEVFGDGALVRPNLNLDPERSHNVNLGVRFDFLENQKLRWYFETNGFLRDAQDLILLLGADNFFAFQNVFSARSLGLEVSGRLTAFRDRITLSANATYQDFRNTSGDGVFGAFEGDRIPNQPYLFANANFSYQLIEAETQNRLNLFGGLRYVNEFFLNWESVSARNKLTVPSQFILNTGLTYSFDLWNNKIDVTGEVQNLNNAKIFDLFGVQLPGRSFFAKLNIRI